MKLKQHHPKAALRILAGLLLFFMTIASPAMASSAGNAWDGKPATQIENAGGGDGTAANPILIKDAAELAYLAQQVNKGGIKLELGNGTDIDNSSVINKEGFVGYYFALSADINLSAHNWTPIGNYPNSFRGHFDGDGYKVKGLKIDLKGVTINVVYVGLFGYVEGGSIRNLGVRLATEGIMVSANGYAYVGGIAGNVYVPISNCYVDSEGKISVTCEDGCIGGIAGYFQDGEITHCYSTTDMEVVVSGDARVGGIAGYCAGEMYYTYATGKMKITNVGSGSVQAGGICGNTYRSIITNNLALNKEINVEGGSSNEVHRIVGATETTPSANYATPRMLLNGKKVSDNTTDVKEGENTYLDKFENKLKDTGGEWDDAWVWPTPTGKLPQLKKKTGSSSYDALLSNQTSYAATDYLPHSPWSENVATIIENAGGNNGLTPNTPIKIKDARELAYFAQQVNARLGIMMINHSGTSLNALIKHDDYGGEGFSAYHFALSDSIDLQAGNWTPIGNNIDHPFSGHFDGKGYTVKGLAIEINKTGGDDGDWTLAGLFGYVENGTLQNIGVELAEEGIQVSAENGHVYAGGITGRIQANGGDATLRHCYVTGKGEIVITQAGETAYAGGIVGLADQPAGVISLTHCYATVNTQASSLNSDSYAGGIAGRSTGELSYCFATGKVEAKSGNTKCAGGISGSSEASNCLALNGSIVGGENWSGRITGVISSSTNNYASPRTQVNGSPLSNQFDPSNTNGADTWLDTFKDDLLKAPATDNNGWKDGNGRKNGWDWPDAPSTLLPKLMVVETDNNGQVTGYVDWPGLPAQRNIDAAKYLDKRQTLHIKQPEHGVLGVFYDRVGTLVPTDPLADGILVGPGSKLKLRYASTTDNYSLSSYRWGTSDSNIPNPISGNTYQMPVHEVWLTALETYTAPEQPPYVPPVYYTVTLPQVEGATTDPAAGEYEVEAWDTFRFYLTLDTAYSESQPVVTTSRYETIKPRTSDGAYLVKYVRSDVEIYIDGIVKNNAVANESITDAAGPRIWSEGSMLCIDLPESHVTTGASPLPVRVLTVDGRLWRTFAASPGLNRWQLPQGLYIVQAGDAVRKVIVR